MVQELPTQATIQLPQPLAEKAFALANEQKWSFEDALLYLIKRGIIDREASGSRLLSAYDRYLNSDEANRDEAGNDLIRTIFGPKSVA